MDAFRGAGVMFVLVVYGVVGCGEVPAQHVQDSGGTLSPEQAAYDVTHYELDVQVHPDSQTLEGRLSVRANVTDSLAVLVLDLDHRLSVRGVKAGMAGAEGPSLSYERRAGGDELWIDLPAQKTAGDEIRATIAYGGTPRTAPRPPWEGGLTWAQTPTGAPWIATSGQTAGADLWWPVKDHPSDEPDSMDISITVPDPLTAASNGRLRSVEEASDSTTTYHWHVSTSINAYAVTLNAAPYERIDTTYTSTAGTEVPVSFYALSDATAPARENLPYFLKHMRFFEERLGPYPFRADKYGIAQTPFLGMEHQTLISYGSDFRRQGGLGYQADFDALHFHELAHEWYGNCVTVRDWKDFWIHEGTATYLEALYTESLNGRTAYHDLIEYFRRQVDNQSPIARREAASAQEVYDADVYYKGALVLHTLRSMMGNEALTQWLGDFVYPDGTDPATACRHVDTGDFLARAETILGRDLDAFADTYLYQASLPRLVSTRTDGTLRLTWKNAADGFAVPVPVAVGDTTHTVSMTGGKGQMSIPAGTSVTVDPKDWVLRAREPLTPHEKRRRRSRE